MNPLDLRVRRPLRQVPQSEWSDWKSEGHVIAEMLSKSGFQDKTIAIEIGVDPAIVSKVKTGQARFSEEGMNDFMDACGSEAWLHFWLLKRGYDPRFVRRIETDLEQENRMLREKLEKVEQERAVEIRLLREIRATP